MKPVHSNKAGVMEATLFAEDETSELKFVGLSIRTPDKNGNWNNSELKHLCTINLNQIENTAILLMSMARAVKTIKGLNEEF